MMESGRNPQNAFVQGSNMMCSIFLKCHSSFLVENGLLRIRVDAERSFRKFIELCKSVMGFRVFSVFCKKRLVGFSIYS